MKGSPLVKLASIGAVAFFVLIGLWSFFVPRSFFDALVAFPPFNAHLLRDIGAFNLGIGAAVLAALKWQDALAVALAGASTAAVLHVVSHIVDSDLGGKPTDVPLLGLLAVLLVAGTLARLKEVKQ